MITKIQIRNFKRFKDIWFELGQVVVLMGPNNSGKTTALQALALWDIGLRQWLSKRGGKATPDKRPGVTINRKDLISIPTPHADLLWRELHTRNVTRDEDNKQRTNNVLIDIIVEGLSAKGPWKCGLEFDYANPESFYCRPLRDPDNAGRMIIPEEASEKKIAFLPPMSGLAAIEEKHERGRIDVLIGEGQTAQVLRNLSYQIFNEGINWNRLCAQINQLFGVRLNDPSYIRERGEITMEFTENGIKMDISSSGRGLQQILLLLCHLYSNPNSVLLLDEPDAHLEIIRQRQIYQLLTDVAREQKSQIVAASHSEVLLSEAASRDMVIAFVGRPHRIDDRGSQLLKSLKDIGFDQYYLAEQVGWVLYLEGSTDLAILREFAKTLNHEALIYLDKPFVHYVENKSTKASEHFFGLREAKPDLKGIAIFDKIVLPESSHPDLILACWSKCEIENYLCIKEVLLQYASGKPADDLFESGKSGERIAAMNNSISEIESALRTLDEPDPWSGNLKVSDKFLARLFENYYKRLNQPNIMTKTNYHILASLVPKNQIEKEIPEKLDAICEVAKHAHPLLS